MNLIIMFFFSVTFKSLKSDLADVTIKVGGVVELQLVFGDIVNETTDAVVNSTNFTNFQGEKLCG